MIKRFIILRGLLLAGWGMGVLTLSTVGSAAPPGSNSVNLGFDPNLEVSQAPGPRPQIIIPSLRGTRPAAPTQETAPAPQGSDPFGTARPRLPLLSSGPAGLGATPKPSPEILRRYSQFIERTVDPENTLDLVLGRPRLLVFKEAPQRIQVADERIANGRLISEQELSLAGQSVGTTVLNLWFADPQEPAKPKILSYLVRVIPDPEAKQRLERVYKALEEEINRSFPDSVVHLALVGDKLVLTGQAKDIAEAAQILRVVRANAPGEAARIPVDRIELNLTPGELGPNGLAPQGLQNFLLAGGPNVINLLRVPGEQQVMLRVTVAEVNRAAARSIGLNFSVRNHQGMTVFSNTTGNIGSNGQGSGTSQGGGTTQAGGQNNLNAMLNGGKISLAINALRTLNFARSLAEPTLTAFNGQTASFQAGGQFPVPVVTGFTAAGLQGVSFVPFGVQLSFTPVITDKDRIRLAVSSEVSTRDLSSTTNVGGSSVPGLNTRNFSTTVELREGETLAVAGLIQNNFGADASRVPLLGDLPVVGRLAAFDRTTAAEQELIVLVTPELVHPLDCTQTPNLPGSDLFEPGDLEFYLLGRLESRRASDYRSPVMTDIARMIRYRRCEQIFIAGPQGHSDGRH